MLGIFRVHEMSSVDDSESQNLMQHFARREFLLISSPHDPENRNWSSSINKLKFERGNILKWPPNKFGWSFSFIFVFIFRPAIYLLLCNVFIFFLASVSVISIDFVMFVYVNFLIFFVYRLFLLFLFLFFFHFVSCMNFSPTFFDRNFSLCFSAHNW